MGKVVHRGLSQGSSKSTVKSSHGHTKLIGYIRHLKVFAQIILHPNLGLRNGFIRMSAVLLIKTD